MTSQNQIDRVYCRLTVASAKMRHRLYEPFVQLRGPSQPLLWHRRELGLTYSLVAPLLSGGLERAGSRGEGLDQMRTGSMPKLPLGDEQMGGKRGLRREKKKNDESKHTSGICRSFFGWMLSAVECAVLSDLHANNRNLWCHEIRSGKDRSLHPQRLWAVKIGSSLKAEPSHCNQKPLLAAECRRQLVSAGLPECWVEGKEKMRDENPQTERAFSRRRLKK